MSQNPFKTREFKDLFRHWNQVLEKDGFVDAEDFSLPDPVLKSWHSLKWQKKEDVKRGEDSKNYYELASDLLNDGFPFRNDVYRRVWELHCKGKSVRDIEEILDYQMFGYKGRTKTRVHVVIREIQKRSGLKSE